jgi:excinuclease ABC subunit C
MTVLLDGELAPREYRHFRIKTLAGDDFSSLYETLSRRFRRAASDDPKWAMPQLIVIDGGKGQLSVAQAALKDAGLNKESVKPDLVSLAKERGEDNAAGEERPERVFLGGVKEPLRLRSNTSELYLLTKLRDEAHRFAITHHKKLRRRKTLRSALDDIEGIGPKRKRQLLKSLGSLKGVRQASYEELQAVPGISSKAAEAVFRYFAGSETPTEE